MDNKRYNFKDTRGYFAYSQALIMLNTTTWYVSCVDSTYPAISESSNASHYNWFAYSPTSRQTTDQVKFYQVKNGKEVPISGWRKVPDTVSLHDLNE